MASNDIPTLLSNLEVFTRVNSDVCQKAVNILQDCGTVVEIAPQMVMFSEQDTNVDEALVVLEGTFRVIKPDGFEIMGQGPELLGELGIITPNQRRTATVIAASQIKGLKFTWPIFMVKVAQMLNEEEQKALNDAIKEFAWNHFVG